MGYIMQATREELAWAAGLFEGEGYFTTNRRSGGYLSVSCGLGMTDEDRVREFFRIVGVGNITTHKSDKSPDYYKPMYVWKTASFEGTQAVIAFLWGWLGPRRRAKAKQVLQDYRDYTNIRRFPLATNGEVLEVRRLLASGMPKRKVAVTVGRSYGFVNGIKSGRTHGDGDHPGGADAQ